MTRAATLVKSSPFVCASLLKIEEAPGVVIGFIFLISLFIIFHYFFNVGIFYRISFNCQVLFTFLNISRVYSAQQCSSV